MEDFDNDFLESQIEAYNKFQNIRNSNNGSQLNKVKRSEQPVYSMSHTPAEVCKVSPRVEDEEGFFGEDELEYVCPYEECGSIFSSVEVFEAHVDLHISENKGSRRDLHEGYVEQYEQTIIRVYSNGRISKKRMEKLINQMRKNLKKADVHTRVKGTLSNIKSVYKHHKDFEYHLCKRVDHYFSGPGDAGWGCGYRNLQMMCSYLMHLSHFKKTLFDGCGFIPGIVSIQEWIEECWKAGYDPEGSKIYFKGLKGTKGLIGTTDVAALLRYFGIRMDIVDFLSKQVPEEVLEYQAEGKKVLYYPNEELLKWVWNYFSERNKKKVFKPPLYLQYAGHSRTIVGADKNPGDGSISLIIFDPAHNGLADKNQIKHKGVLAPVRKTLEHFTLASYQIGYISSTEKLNDTESEKAKAMDFLGKKN